MDNNKSELEELATRTYGLSDAHSSVRIEATHLYMQLLDAAWSDLESVYPRVMFEHFPNTREKSNFVRPNVEQAEVLQHLIALCDLLDTVRPLHQQNGRHPEPRLQGGIDLCSHRVAAVKHYAVMQIATIGMDDEALWLCLGHVLEPWLAVKHIMEERDQACRRVDELRSLVLERLAAEDAECSDE